MAFCDKLRILIEEHDITQKNLALDLQIPASTLGGYVQGTSEPDFGTLKLLAGYFHVSADYLLDIPDNRTKSEKENELLRVFRALPPEQQELYLEQGKTFIRVNAKGAEKSSKSIFKADGKAG